MKSNLHDSSDFQSYSYDFKLAKIECSIKWLLIMASSKSPNFMKSVTSITAGLGLNPVVEKLLISGQAYLHVAEKIFKIGFMNKNAIGDVLSVLCQNGQYIVGQNEEVLTAKKLQDTPLNIDAHLQMIDMLMVAASYNLWSPINKVADKLTRISHGKHNLSSLQDAIFSWLNAVVQKVKFMEEKIAEVNSSKDYSNQQQRSECYYPEVWSGVDELCDSCLLVYLLHYYCPNHIRLENLVIKPKLTRSEAISNLRVCLRFCYGTLFKRGQLLLDHLSTGNFVNSHQHFTSHIIAFYSFLFYTLELHPDPLFVKPRDQLLNTSHHHQPVGNKPSAFRPQSELSRTIDQVVKPQVESLLSEATKRSFNHNNNSQATSACQPSSTTKPNTTNLQQSNDPGLMTSSTSMRSKWIVSNNVVPFTAASSDSNLSSHDGVVSSTTSSIDGVKSTARSGSGGDATAGAEAARKFYERADINMKNLLSRVDIDDDCDVTIGSGGREESGDAEVSWDGFVRKSAHRTGDVRSSRNVDDIRLETYRTADEALTPHQHHCGGGESGTCTPINRFMAEPVTNYQQARSANSSWSDFTQVSQLQDPANLMVASQQPHQVAASLQHHPLVSTIPQQPHQVATSLQQYQQASYPSKVTQNNTVEASYSIPDRSFNTVESARAAGYPVIYNSNHNNPASSSYQLQKRPMSSIVLGSGGDMMTSSLATSSPMTTAQQRRIYHQPTTSHNQPNVSASNNAVGEGVSNSHVRRSKLVSMADLRQPSTQQRDDPNIMMVNSTAVRLRRNPSSAARRRIGKVKSCFDISSHVQTSPVSANTLRDSQIYEISQRLDSIRVEIDRIRREEEEGSNRQPSENMVATNQQQQPDLIATNASPIPHHYNRQDHHIDQIQQHLHQANSDFQNLSVDSKCLVVNHRRATPSPRSNQHTPSPRTPNQHSPSLNRNSYIHPNDSSCSPQIQHNEVSTSLYNDTSSWRVEDEIESRSGKGFIICSEEDGATPEHQQNIEKRKNQFFQNRLRKEKDLREKQMKREVEALERKQQKREKEEEEARKKKEKEEKRRRLLDKHKKVKQEQQDKSVAYRQPGIISTGGLKRTPKSKSTTNLIDAHNSFKSLASLAENESHYGGMSSASSSKNHHHYTPRSMASNLSERDLSDFDSVVSAPPSHYSGPKLYKQLVSKSNKALIKNAVLHSCLPGKVNENHRRKALNALDRVEAGHFMILFRDHQLQYRAIYDFDVECEKLHKITGVGPSLIKPNMLHDLYKYNSGKRTFTKIPSKTLSMSIDAVTIQSHLWSNSSTKR